MAQVELIKIFLACPSDVATEADMVRQILESVNRSVAESHGVRLDLYHWKTNTYPEYGQEPQALVNGQIADMSEYGLFVGIMWNRFGTPTSRAGSGTEEEFDRAVASFEQVGKPQIMFYFNQTPENLDTVERVDQKRHVLDFRDRVRKKAITHDYDGLEAFKDTFRDNIETWIVRNSGVKLRAPTVESPPVVATTSEQPTPSRTQITDTSGSWVLIKDRFFEALEVSEHAEGIVKVQVPVKHAMEDAAFRELQPSSFGRNEPILFAYQNVGAIAKVQRMQRLSSREGDIWEIELRLDSNRNDFFSEMAFGRLSADEIATLRARYILLNEKPPPSSKGNRLDHSLLEVFVSGLRSPISVDGNTLLNLWSAMGKNAEAFLPLARLSCVLQLLTSNTCQFVLELTLGPVIGNQLHVKFRGQRYKQYTNVDPFIIEVEGECDLGKPSDSS